jgi:membrane protein YdbS with pleckstrin-like domain
MSLFAQHGMPGPNIILISVTILIPLLWIFSIIFGIKVALKKHYSPLWMLFGLHPIAGWAVFITLCILPPQKQCPNLRCQKWIYATHRVCPYCQTEQPIYKLDEPQNGRI